MAIRSNLNPDGTVFHSAPFTESAFAPDNIRLEYRVAWQVDSEERSLSELVDVTWAGAREFFPNFLGILWSGESFNVTFFSTGHTGPIAFEVREFSTNDVLDASYILPGETSTGSRSVTLGEDEIAVGFAYAPNQPPAV